MIDKEKVFKGIKILVIILLVMAIAVLVILNWKSDLIVKKVLEGVQKEMRDTMHYSDATLDIFGHFPSTAIRITDLHIGPKAHPLIDGGDIDVVIGLIALLKGNVIVNQLNVTSANIHIENHDGKWTYDIMKPSEESGDSTFNTKINELHLEDTRIYYDDGEGLSLALEVADGLLEGGLEKQKLDLSIDLKSNLSGLKMDDYVLKEAIPMTFTGEYTYDLTTGLQELKEWHVDNDAIQLSANGTIYRQKDHEDVNMELSWSKANIEALKKWLPADMRKTWEQYTFSGSVEGDAVIKGKSSKKHTPKITATAKLKNGSIRFLSSKEEIKGLDIDVQYDNQFGSKQNISALDIRFEKDAMLGQSLKGTVNLRDLDNPVLDLDLSGSLPSALLNLLEIDRLKFEKGTIQINDFALSGFKTSTASFDYFIDHGKTSLEANDLKFVYLNNQISIPAGTLKLADKKLDISFDEFTWNKATTNDLLGEIKSGDAQIDYSLQGKLCEGEVVVKGNVSGLGQRPVSGATWKVKGIEMQKLLQSFSDFDQTFITSENLSGKADIWATSIFPFDEKWNLLTKGVQVKAAIDIKDGRLKSMKTLEDFSDYVHLSELQDVRFSQLRNYMKIENGVVKLPVMFIQSSALNMSISGEHSFDQDILYHLKLNAGQVAGNKVKKESFLKSLKPARKSGWINMYFVLSGTTSNVKYQQDRIEVIAGFERTTLMKEELRNYLVDQFGYDVYWLEPNEWEDIPEY